MMIGISCSFSFVSGIMMMKPLPDHHLSGKKANLGQDDIGISYYICDHPNLEVPPGIAVPVLSSALETGPDPASSSASFLW